MTVKIESLGTAMQSLASLTDQLSNGKLKKRKLVLDTLESVSSDIESYMEESSKVVSHRPMRKEIKRIGNTIGDLHQGVESGELKYTEMKSIIQDSVEERIDTMGVLILASSKKVEKGEDPFLAEIEKIKARDDISEFDKKVKTKELFDQQAEHIKSESNVDSKTAATKQYGRTKDITTKLKAKYERRLPLKLKNPDTFQILEMPVQVDFSKYPKLLSSKNLNKRGIEHIPLSFDRDDYADLGLILPNQILLTFDQNYVKRIEDEEREEYEQGGVVGRFKATISGLTKQINALKRSIKLDEAELAKVKAPAAKRKFKNSIKTSQEQIEDLSKRKAAVSSQKSDELKRSRKRRPKNPSAKDIQEYLYRYAVGAVDIINERSATEYLVVSDYYIKNKRNSNLVMFWIMPTSQYNRLKSIDNRMAVMKEQWFFPWSDQTGTRAHRKHKPTSLDAPTRLSRSVIR